MKVVPLQLTPRPHAVRAATAWLVPGAAPADWLAEVVQWPVQQSELRFLMVPNATDHSPDAVLVLLLEPLPESFHVRRALPYGLVGKNLYVPCEAELEPALTDREWSTLLPGDERFYVWGAPGDLVGFEPTDVRNVADLLTAPVVVSGSWTEARDLPAFVTRLRSITSSMPLPTMEDVAAQWQNEVGLPESPSNLPPLPGEAPLHWTERLAKSTGGIRKAWRSMAKGLHAFFQRFRGALNTIAMVLLGLVLVLILRNLGSMTLGGWTEILVFLLIASVIAALLWAGRSLRNGADSGPPSHQPASGQAGGGSIARGMQSLWAWFRGSVVAAMPKGMSGMSLSPFAEADRRQREREVQRLLTMLDQNPEEGLRHAIPFGGEAGRGVAPAGNSLIARDLHFSLGWSGGGAAADYWDISVEHQLRLTASYRQLAEREQRAGRHRRAAYIYSQLLDDWRSAATALVAGHHYADAAVIYEKRLHHNAEAARCYELAGQFDKALRLYVDSSNWLAAGDLCTRVERIEEARTHYRTAVGTAYANGNIPYAAELLEQKLHEVDEALQLLSVNWPKGTRADECLDAWFDLTARHHRTDIAAQRVAALSQQTTHADALRLLPRLKRVHQQYPDASVQREASEATLQVVARHLADATPPAAQTLTSYLPALVPNDRLLSRDCQRYVEQCRSQVPPPPVIKKTPSLLLDQQFSIGDVPFLVPVFASDYGWAVLSTATTSQKQLLILTSWSEVTSRCWLDQKSKSTALVGLSPRHREIWLKASLAPLRVRWNSGTEHWNVISPEYLPENAFHVLPGDAISRVMWFDSMGAIWLSYIALHGSNIRSVRIAEEWLGNPQQAAPLLRGRAAMHAFGDHEVMTFLPVGDDQVFAEHFDRNGIRVWMGMLPGDEVVCLSERDSRRVVLLQKDAVIVLEDVFSPESSQRVLSGWQSPKAVLMMNDLFAVVDELRVALFRIGESHPVIDHQHHATTPVAIARCSANRFSVLRSNGTVEVWHW